MAYPLDLRGSKAHFRRLNDNVNDAREGNSSSQVASDVDLTNSYDHLYTAYNMAAAASTMHGELTAGSDEEVTTPNGQDSDSGHGSMNGGTRSQPMGHKTYADATWFTRPLNKELHGHSSVTRSTGQLGAALAAKHSHTNTLNGRELELYRSSVGHLASQYFPVTLGAGGTLPSSHRKHKGQTQSHSSRRSRPGSAHSTSSSTSKSSLDKLYLFNTEAPALSSAPSLVVSSPYEHELARLRMERLKIEEERLLEMKRQQELEKLRGPLPKWYELKSPRFHYEAHKNNELLKKPEQWQDMLEYSRALTQASKKYGNYF